MPCYNAGHYVETAIESALSQECPIQLIVIDDGSTDDTAARAKRYAPDIKLIQTTNQGVSEARNTALSFLTAPYTLLLDADDRLAPHALKHLLSAIDGKQDCLAYGMFQSWNADMTEPLSQAVLQPLSPDAFHHLSRQNFSPPGAVLFPSTSFKRVGGFDPALDVGEDWDFWIRLARIGLRFMRVKKTVFHYRRMPSTASNQPLRALTDGIEVIQRSHRPDPRVRDDQFPSGLAESALAQKTFCYGADCFALAAMRDNQEEMDLLFRRIPVPEHPDWKAFGTSLRQAAWFHSDIHNADRRSGFCAGLATAACFLAQRGFQDRLKTILYPDFSPLFIRPGPQKAIRLLREWREARTIVNSLCRQRRNA